MQTTNALWQTLKQTVTDARAWLALAENYRQLALPWQASYAARQAARCDPALRPQLDALNLPQSQDTSQGDALLGRAILPEAADLIGRFAEQLKYCPSDWLTALYLARLQEIVNQSNQETLAQARNLEIIAGETLHWLGVWRLNAGDAQGAVQAFAGLLDLQPQRHGSMLFLGEALLRIGNIAAAEKAFTRASLSNNPDFLLTLANKVYSYNYWQEAIGVLQKAASLRSEHVPTWLALAKIQSEVYDLAECRASLNRVRALQPDNLELALLDAGLQGRMGDARGHLQTLQAAYQNGGDPLSRLASSVAMTALYHDQLPPAEIAELHRKLCAPIVAAMQANARQKNDFSNDRSPNRRLRIGYLTGDLHRQHPVNLFMLPVLLRHNHQRFEICIYYTGILHDDYTRQAKNASDRWLEAAGMDDQALQQAIINDGVDILVDLAGHTATHRLGVLALRAAPVQATFLGYPHSSGLPSIDWLIGDATVSPAEHAHLFSEGIAQLPGSVFCWASVDHYPLPPARPVDAPVVFGSFNNAMKLTPKTIRLWAQVLLAVPDSQLLLKAPSLKDPEVQQRFANLFAEHGIARERLHFRGPCGLADMMQEYGDMDIALDPTSYNGGTTTLQALWMGVPAISLMGGNFVSRMGASFLLNLGQSDWLAADEDDYIAKAAQLAQNLNHWRQERGALRAQMMASPLSDIGTYTENMQVLYQRMWLAFVTGDTTRLLLATH